MIAPASLLRHGRVLAPILLLVLILLAIFTSRHQNPYFPAAINGHGFLPNAGTSASKHAAAEQHCSNIPALIHQNYFFPQSAKSKPTDDVPADELPTSPRYKAKTHSASWQATPFVYNFYSLESARNLIPQLSGRLPSTSKYTVDDYIRTWESLPLGMLRADFWRYMVLYLYGGIYADLDVKLVTDLPWAILCDETTATSGDAAADVSKESPAKSEPDIAKVDPEKSVLDKAMDDAIPASGNSRIHNRAGIVSALREKFSSHEPLGLVVGIEGDDTVGGLARGLQIVQWCVSSPFDKLDAILSTRD